MQHVLQQHLGSAVAHGAAAAALHAQRRRRGEDASPPLVALNLAQSRTQAHSGDDVLLAFRDFSADAGEWYVVIVRLALCGPHALPVLVSRSQSSTPCSRRAWAPRMHGPCC